MTRARTLQLISCTFAALALASCGGGQASIGGTVSGLTSGLRVVLQNNGTDNTTVTGTSAAAIAFAFPTEILANGTYNATVLTQPPGQTCVVANGSGTVATTAADVANVTVTCTTTSTIIGTVSGLSSGVAVTLRSNGTNMVVGNGNFSFPGILTAGSIYSVTVATQPAGQTCSIQNYTGTVVANTASNVTVTCF